MEQLKLLVCVKVFREKFIMESFCGSDDIFALVQKGSFIFESPEGKETVCENEGVLFKRNVLYRRKVLTPVTMYLFRYRSDLPCFHSEKVVFHDVGRICSTLDLLDKLEGYPFADLLRYRKMLFCDIVTQYQIENSTLNYNTPHYDKAIEKAITMMNQKFDQKLNVDTIADVCGLSHAQFYRRFHQAMKCSPYDYILQLRLQKAKDLLANGSLPIYEVGRLCGFEDEYYFSNFIKKHMGVSPTAFRKSAL